MIEKRKYILEVSPPDDPRKLDHFVKCNQKLVANFSNWILISHPIKGTTISGFDKAINLVEFGNMPGTIMTISCNDINYVNARKAMEAIPVVVKEVLIVTGQDYEQPVNKRELFFRDSEELVEFIIKEFPNRFESIGIAAYPGAESIQLELTRLKRKLKPQINKLYCQYSEDPKTVNKFIEAVRQDEAFKNIEVIPCVALYDSPESYNRAMQLMRIPMTQTSRFFHPDGKGIQSLNSISALEVISSYVTRIRSNRVVISPFGLYNVALKLIEKLDHVHPN